MKQYKLLSLLVVISLLIAACGGAPAAAPAAEAPAAAEAAPAANRSPSSRGSTRRSRSASSRGSSSRCRCQRSTNMGSQVAAGELPALEERLQGSIRVGPGVLLAETSLADWTPGQYKDGSVLRTAHSVADWAPDVFVMLNEPALSAPDLGVQNIRGNVLKDFEVADDNKVFTFHMREGLKWSDGEPVTTKDVAFTWNDIYGNNKLTPGG